MILVSLELFVSPVLDEIVTPLDSTLRWFLFGFCRYVVGEMTDGGIDLSDYR